MTTTTATVPADYAAVRRIGPLLRKQLETADGRHLLHRLGEIELAVHELAVNIIDHAFDELTRATASFQLQLGFARGDLVVTCTDSGAPYEAANRPVIGDEPSIRGYGLFIVEQLASSISYDRRDDQNHWVLTFGSSASASQHPCPAPSTSPR